jgi:RNA binding exosome subunit
MLTHVEPETLRVLIQEKLIETEQSRRVYDAVILGFGLCGNAVIGLSCSIQMVIPRAHDCCTLFMGSKESFLAEFGNALSTRWMTTGYYERTVSSNTGYRVQDTQDNYKTSAQYMEFLEKYDAETAEYLWETLHPKIESHEAVYIKIDGFEYHDALQQYKQRMEDNDIELRVATGNVSLLKALIDADWDDERFLRIPAGQKIVGVYDMDQVMRAE